MLETRVDTSISVSVAVEAISGARLGRRDESGWPCVPVLGAVGVVAVAWTAWTGVHSPVLVNPSAVGLWRAAIVAAYWAVGTYTWSAATREPVGSGRHRGGIGVRRHLAGGLGCLAGPHAGNGRVGRLRRVHGLHVSVLPERPA